jgi:hypothetical protein
MKKTLSNRDVGSENEKIYEKQDSCHLGEGINGFSVVADKYNEYTSQENIISCIEAVHSSFLCHVP